MRVFVAGATGAIGTRLVPRLVESGHHVIGTSRSREKAERLAAQGAEPVVLDLLDARAVREALAAARPDAIVHQATSLAGGLDIKHFDRSFAQTNRLRVEGTDALLAAARAAGVERFVAQSYAGWPSGRGGGEVVTEQEPLDPDPLPEMRGTLDAIRHLEETVVEAGGLALRYGGFYGSPDDVQLEPVRKRQFPIVGDGGGVWSFVHLDDAAAATVLALERGDPGVYNVVDDDPAPVREWLPALAEAIGAKPPRHVPTWLARILAGEVGVMMLTESRGASNAKAKRELGWTLRYPSWREGFTAAYARVGTEQGGLSRVA
ncbi:MAG TPA: NAD(P)-dependent oxidoreductase [Gaiella sp.]|uniref:NAD-dependent epimerase/dehydratase family protein n=1 Tax=Gaiella sp. TaxID=2663207 RepID=UPI002D80E5D4|nr:NAD(P)-dependent oxidoreductase [Gaiella sp.]HET9287540.1 NAD(P)-dependent oxidoreductase [Gaiella sp.]